MKAENVSFSLRAFLFLYMKGLPFYRKTKISNFKCSNIGQLPLAQPVPYSMYKKAALSASLFTIRVNWTLTTFAGSLNQPHCQDVPSGQPKISDIFSWRLHIIYCSLRPQICEIIYIKTLNIFHRFKELMRLD